MSNRLIHVINRNLDYVQRLELDGSITKLGYSNAFGYCGQSVLHILNGNVYIGGSILFRPLIGQVSQAKQLNDTIIVVIIKTDSNTTKFAVIFDLTTRLSISLTNYQSSNKYDTIVVMYDIVTVVGSHSLAYLDQDGKSYVIKGINMHPGHTGYISVWSDSEFEVHPGVGDRWKFIGQSDAKYFLANNDNVIQLIDNKMYKIHKTNGRSLLHTAKNTIKSAVYVPNDYTIIFDVISYTDHDICQISLLVDDHNVVCRNEVLRTITQRAGNVFATCSGTEHILFDVGGQIIARVKNDTFYNLRNCILFR